MHRLRYPMTLSRNPKSAAAVTDLRAPDRISWVLDSGL